MLKEEQAMKTNGRHSDERSTAMKEQNKPMWRVVVPEECAGAALSKRTFYSTRQEARQIAAGANRYLRGRHKCNGTCYVERVFPSNAETKGARQ